MSEQAEPEEVVTAFGHVESTKHQPAVSLAVGGFRYAMKHSPRCVVCNSRERFSIEESLILGRSYTAIQRGLPDIHTDPDSPDFIGVEQIRSHMRRHMDQSAQVGRVMLEKHREELGRAIEAAEGTLVDSYNAAFEVVRLGYENMVRNPESVTIKDMLTAAKLVNDMEQAQSGAANLNLEVQTQMLSLLLSHVQRMMTDDQFNTLSVAFKNDPVFLALAAQLKEQPRAITAGEES